MKEKQVRTVFILFICIFLNPWSTLAFASPATTIDLSKANWEYRWGDAFPNEPLGEWKSIPFPSNPPERGDKTNVWYRVLLPQILPPNPTLYIFSIDLISEVYLHDKRIYSFGTFDANGRGKFKGWPWHMISLDEEAAGEYLYFRIYSDYPDIGLWGEITLASQAEHIKKMLNEDLFRLATGSVAIFLGIIFIAVFIIGKSKIAPLLLGSLFLTQGVDLIFSTKIIQLYFNHPLLKQNVLAFCYFYLPVGIGAFLEQMITNRFRILFRLIWQFHLTFIIIAFGVSLMGLESISSLYVYFDYLHYSITFPLLTFLMFYTVVKGNKNEKIASIGLLVLLLSWAYSSLIAWGLVEWREHPNYIHTFICLMLFTYVLTRKMSHAQELEITNNKLAKANQELQIAHTKLTKLATYDTLTKLYNRNKIDEYLQDEINIVDRYGGSFGLILLDIDDFKKVNDTFGHLAGDEVLLTLAQCLKSHLRQSDILGRWGGEEFIILCRKCSLENTDELAQKLCLAIQKHPFPHVKTLKASFGISIYQSNDDANTLFEKIDKALYQAKFKGKNRVETIVYDSSHVKK
jgi:diguanylate cyclase (GGDEF)-like protein